MIISKFLILGILAAFLVGTTTTVVMTAVLRPVEAKVNCSGDAVNPSRINPGNDVEVCAGGTSYKRLPDCDVCLYPDHGGTGGRIASEGDTATGSYGGVFTDGNVGRHYEFDDDSNRVVGTPPISCPSCSGPFPPSGTYPLESLPPRSQTSP